MQDTSPGRADDLYAYFERLHGHTAGYLFAARGTPSVAANGKVHHPDFREEVFAWPRQAGALAAWLLEHSAAQDVWCTPGASFNPVRRLKYRRSLASSHPWCDLDNPTLDQLARLHRLVERGGFTVNSGHGVHGYVRLARPVNPGQLQVLNRQLAAHLHADPAPAAINAFLRPPGTWNRKATPPARVAFLQVVDGPGWNAEQLALRLPPPGATYTQRSVTAAPEAAPAMLPLTIAGILDDPAAAALDRSARLFVLVRTCRNAGLTDGQTLTVAAQHQPSRAKYGRRLRAETVRILAKLPEPSR